MKSRGGYSSLMLRIDFRVNRKRKFLVACSLAFLVFLPSLVTASPEVPQPTPLTILNQRMQGLTGYGVYWDATSSWLVSSVKFSPFPPSVNGSQDTSLWDWKLCDSTTSSGCEPGDSNWMEAISVLGVCGNPDETGCIEDVQRKVSDGNSESLVRSDYIGQENIFPENPELDIPRGSSPSTWNASDGSKYVITGATTRSFVSSAGQWGTNYSRFQLQVERVSSTEVLTPGSVQIAPSPYHAGKNIVVGGGIGYTPLMFDDQTKFTVKVRLPNVVKGWFQARIQNGSVGSTSLSSERTLYEISGEVSRVQVAGGAVSQASLPSNFFSKLYNSAVNIGVGGVLGPGDPGNGTRSMVEYEAWLPYLNDRALTTLQQWNVRSSGWPVSNSCFSNLSGVTGLLATNAAVYIGSPPDWDESDGSLAYKVASPHVDENGIDVVGSYTLSLPAAAARCLYGTTQLPPTVVLSVEYSESGTESNTVLVLNEVKGWLNFSVKGFHYSSPTIKVKLGRVSTPLVNPTMGQNVSPSTTSSTTTTIVVAPVPVTTPVVIPVAAKIPVKTQPALSLKRSATAKSIAGFAKLTVVKSSKVTVRVLATSSRYCKAVGASVKGLRAGSCKVKVTVTPRKGKSISRTVTLKVSK
jgi:hypothetical protein